MRSTKYSYSLFLYSRRVDENDIVTGNGGTVRSLLSVSQCCGCSDGGAHVSNCRQATMSRCAAMRPVCSAEFITYRRTCRLRRRRRPTVFLLRRRVSVSSQACVQRARKSWRRPRRTGVAHALYAAAAMAAAAAAAASTPNDICTRTREAHTERPRFESDERVNNKNGMINISVPIGARGEYVTRAPRPPGRKTNNLLAVRRPHDTINGKFLSNFSSDRDVIFAPSIYPPVSGKG